MPGLRRYGGLYELVTAQDRALIRRLLCGGDPGLWQQARHVVISPAPLVTLGMAVTRISPQPVTGVPDAFTVYRALRHASALYYSFQRRSGRTPRG
ncbi:MAG: hypothetical protein GWO16_09875 [Gammaproteobacteria bacterium]|nr:hypothetical protein [Gammaproteobacteria bacterium]NIR98272.1 hypothetical protein [Gammaproteobacteria bacterium]NIT63947.1 hypothetical protein [Gammaproteobacteria bacterium]NIV20945.1 hypothetical protein [Gammaproteobacteria bacterium]NIX10236.1 hypothetical protein [Gammaproteobacteria bacterium]